MGAIAAVDLPATQCGRGQRCAQRFITLRGVQVGFNVFHTHELELTLVSQRLPVNASNSEWPKGGSVSARKILMAVGF